MKRPTLLILLLAPVALAGCQTIKAHNPFRHREPAYKAAQQEPPLQVPPSLQQPPTNEALVIPSASTKAALANAAPPSAHLSNKGSNDNNPVTSGALTLSDTPASAYRRVGLALARGEAGSVLSHDDATHTYKVAVSTTVTKKPGGGFFHRLFHHTKTVAVTGNVIVSVVPKGKDSVVSAEGKPVVVAKVMDVLKRRLK